MSDYRRLISYIYAYEGGEKGKNIGFARLICVACSAAFR